MAAKKLIQMFVVGLMAVSVISCSKSKEEKAQDESTKLVQQFNTLKDQIVTTATTKSSWTVAELTAFDKKLDKLQSIYNRLQALDGTNGINITGGWNTKRDIAELKAAVRRLRSNLNSSRANVAYNSIEANLSEAEELHGYAETHDEVVADLQKRTTTLMSVYALYSSKEIMDDGDFNELVSIKDEYNTQYEYAVNYRDSLKKLNKYDMDEIVRDTLNPHILNLEGVIGVLDIFIDSQTELRSLDLSAISEEDLHTMSNKEDIRVLGLYTSMNYMDYYDLQGLGLKVRNSLIVLDMIFQEFERRMRSGSLTDYDAASAKMADLEESIITLDLFTLSIDSKKVLISTPKGY